MQKTNFDTDKMKAQSIPKDRRDKVISIQREFKSLKSKGRVVTIDDAEKFFIRKLVNL